MDLIAVAIPFFLLALLVELGVDLYRGSGHYRTNDALNSLSAGTLSTTFGYFTGFLSVAVWGYVLQHFAIFQLPLPWFNLSPRGACLWLIALVGWDFCYYWRHRLGHEISILWAAHAVHHQSEDYNLSTALRQTSTGFVFDWIFYLPLFLIGFPYEVLLTVSGVNLIYQFWVHTQKIRNLGWMDRVFVTPSNHRVHHAQNEIYIDRNYGGILVLWDRLFGSFQDELDAEPVVFGVRKPLASWNPFQANLQVYKYLWFDASHTKRWRDKIGIWFRRTGWRPADVEKNFPKAPIDIATFQKFDPQLSTGLRNYVIAQFVVAAIAIIWVGGINARLGAPAVIIPCMMIWAVMYTVGLITEGRAYAIRFEVVRLLVITPLGFAGMQSIGVIPVDTLTAPIFCAGYIAASVLSFLLIIKQQVINTL